MTTLPTGLSQIGQIALTVHDLGQAVPFYRDALGMEFLFEVPGMAFFNCGGVRLMLALPEGDDHGHAGSIIYFKVDDITAQSGAMQDRGVKFVAEPEIIADMGSYDLQMAFFTDIDGNSLALMSEVAHRS